MLRTSYIRLQEDYIIHAALYGMFSMHQYRAHPSSR